MLKKRTAALSDGHNLRMRITIKVFPGSKKEEIIEKSKNRFEIYVKAKAIRGLANKAAIQALSLYLNIPPLRLKLIKGAHTPNKIVEIMGSSCFFMLCTFL